MPAFLASSSTASQPVRTTGLKAMTSTRCCTKERIAEIWFSCSPLASENFRSMPAAGAASWMDLVLAVRQPLSAPTWENPKVIFPPSDPLDPPPAGAGPLPHAASTPTVARLITAVKTLFTTTPLMSWFHHLGSGEVRLRPISSAGHGRALEGCDRRYTAKLALTFPRRQQL